MLCSSLLSARTLLVLAKQALAVGCSTHSYTSCEDGIVHWFDPDTGEVCDLIDCGGGRAPPKKNPGCAGYTGTEVRTTSILSCWKPSTAQSLAPSASTVAILTTKADTTEQASAQTSVQINSEVKTDSNTVGTQSNPSSTTLVLSSSSSDVSASGSGSVITTPAATLSTQPQSAQSDTASPTRTPNAGHILDDSAMAAAGAVIGVVIFMQ